MAKLTDFITAENELDGQEQVYIAQSGKTRKTLLQKIKDFIIGTEDIGNTDSIKKNIKDVNAQLNACVKNNSQFFDGDYSILDLSSIQNTGYYYYPDKYADGRNNAPDDFGGVVENISIKGDSYAIQKATSLKQKKYIRYKLNGIWNDWQEIAFAKTYSGNDILLYNGWRANPESCAISLLKSGNLCFMNIEVQGGTGNLGTTIATIPSECSAKTLTILQCRTSDGLKCDLVIQDNTIKIRGGEDNNTITGKTLLINGIWGA